jgi:type II secretory pathway pseudopilin PulG
MLRRFLKNSCEPRAASYEQSRFQFARSSRPEARFRTYRTAKSQDRSRGYILLTLMLFLSLVAIAALAVLPDIALQVKRDREEELIHRGVGYSRAIRRFYKKFGRYPTKIEDLENTNELHFIRKRYKDPITDQDFRILRMGDPALASMMLGQAQGIGLQAQAGVQGALGGIRQTGAFSSNLAQSAGKQTQVTNTDATGEAGNSDTQVSSGSSSSSGGSSSSTQQVFGGGPMLGVVSTSQEKTIREFCKKNHYKDWIFIYDPSTDRGGTITTPWCPIAINQGPGINPLQPVGSPSQPNSGAPGTVPPNPSQPNPGPGANMPPEQ